MRVFFWRVKKKILPGLSSRAAPIPPICCCCCCRSLSSSSRAEQTCRDFRSFGGGWGFQRAGLLLRGAWCRCLIGFGRRMQLSCGGESRAVLPIFLSLYSFYFPLTLSSFCLSFARMSREILTRLHPLSCFSAEHAGLT